MSGDLPFSRSEFQQRIENVHQEMRNRDLKAMILYAPENIFYLTGFQTVGYFTYQCLILPAEKPPILVVRRIEEMNVKITSIIEDYSLFVDAEDPIETTAKTLRDNNLTDNLGLEMDSWFVTVREFQQLQDQMKDVKFADCSGIVEKYR
ncbi:MAG TPA: aminopeptidase P family N-terminal domain-containing protein, partial [Candidatus Hodarchaeales archaeon]|nr:aminopeptidase P family N-terminal domain-containing protein [Candidatus Hodarchaeales archaeon]